MAMLALSLSLASVTRFLFVSSSRSVNLPRTSLLDVYSSAVADFLPCTAHRASLLDSTLSASPAEDKPTIYTGWDVPAVEAGDDGSIANMENFVNTYGHHPQLVKMGDVLPLFDAAGEACTATTKTLVQKMAHRFGAGVGAEDPSLSSRPTAEDLLFFTNDSDSPGFFQSLETEYSAPGLFAGSRWPKIFSAMMRGSAHRFHAHGRGWLGQIAGSRLWFLARHIGDNPRVPACDYLAGRAALPDVDGLMVCVQRAGEVLYLPPEWFHATCGLEEWNMGVGEQDGAPALKEAVVDTSMSEEERRKKLIECGALKKYETRMVRSSSRA